MIRINLVQEQKVKKGGGGGAPKVKAAPGALQAYLLLGLFAGGAALLCAAGYVFKSSQIRDLDGKIRAGEERKKQLQAIKVQVDAFQAKKTLLENKVNLIKQLKAEQKGPVHMLDEVSKALPDFVWLTGLDETRGAVRFSGESNGLTAVAAFMEGLQRSGWFPTVELVSTKEANNIYTFNLAGTFKDPEVAALEKERAAKAAAAAAAAPPPAARRR
jgi:type IV pilus assembly protein PilN